MKIHENSSPDRPKGRMNDFGEGRRRFEGRPSAKAFKGGGGGVDIDSNSRNLI